MKTITEALAAAYTEALIKNPKATVYENMARAVEVTPMPDLRLERQKALSDAANYLRANYRTVATKTELTLPGEVKINFYDIEHVAQEIIKMGAK